MRSLRMPARGEDGFSVIEVITALSVLSVALGSMAPFFVGSFRTVYYQKESQAAVQLASSAIAQVRALKGSSLLSGRGQATSQAQWSAAPAAVTPYLSTMQLAWDTDAVATATTDGADAAVSTATMAMVVENATYDRTIYVGICDIYVGGNNACVNPATNPPPSDPTKDLKFFRVVVHVRWAGCATATTNFCDYVATTLVSRATEPTFDFHRPAPLVKTDPLTFQRGVPVDHQLEATGGQLPNTWAATPLPAGLSVTSTGKISGTPTTVAQTNSMVTVTDSLGRSDVETVVMNVVQPLTLTVPTSAQHHVGEAVALTATATGGNGAPFTYAALGLPGGLTLNATTGAVTGTVTATPQAYTVEITATDKGGTKISKTYVHTVYPAVTLGAIPNQSITLGSSVGVTAVASGGSGSYTYSAVGLPVGVSINASTGVMSGVTLIPGRYLPQVTVVDSVGGTMGTASRMFELVVTTTTALIFTGPTYTTPDRTDAVGDQVVATFETNGALLGLSPALSVTGLPPGLSLNALNGKVTGKPTTPGVYRVTMTAVNLLPPQTTNLTFLWTVT